MRRMAIVAPEGAFLGGIGTVLELFALAARYAGSQHAPEEAAARPVKVDVLTATGAPCLTSCGRRLDADAAWKDVVDVELVCVADFDVAGEADLEARLAAGGAFHTWLAAQRAAGAIIAASGASVFHLAAAGLLRDEIATTPWWLERAFHRLFPQVTLDVAQVIAEGDGVYCAGSARGGPPLALRLAERIFSPNVSSWLAKVSMIDPYPDGPVPWTVFSPNVIRQDGLVGRAQHWLQQRYARKPRIADLAEAMRVSERTLERRFQRSLGMSPLTYLQTLRIQAARQMLARSNRRIDRIAYLVGYADTAFFKEVFAAQVGMSPRDYRRQSAPSRR